MYKKARGNWRKHLDFILIDLGLLLLSYTLSIVIRFRFFENGIYMRDLLNQMGLFLLLIYFVVAMFTESYKNILRRDRYAEVRSVLAQLTLTYIIFILVLYFSQRSILFSRGIMIQTAAYSVVLILAGRIAWKRIIRLRLLNNENLPHMLVIADVKTAQSALKAMKKRRYNNFFISGVVISNKDMKGEVVEDKPVVCNLDDVKEYVLTEVVDEVLINIGNQKKQTELINYLLEAGITVHISLLSTPVDLPNQTTEKIGGHLVLTTSNNTVPGWKLFLKRLMDIAGGIVGLIVCGILFLFLAPQIKKADPGPVFFGQTRVGKNGRHFKLYKFRSMYQDAEARKAELAKENQMEGFIFKMENDPRILPGIGKRMRDTSLDEFPQFWNVLKGDMSLVGTRPPTLDEFEQYDAHHKMRLSFKPGLTGMWQVSGRSAITDFEQIVKLDNEYIKKWGLMLDIRILWKTVGVVLKRKGSM